jgi:hypothetical protein
MFLFPALPFVIANLHPAIRAVECDAIPLERLVSVELIVHIHSVRILHDRRHRVLNIAVLAKDASVAIIAVDVIAFRIKLHKTLVAIDIPV